MGQFVSSLVLEVSFVLELCKKQVIDQVWSVPWMPASVLGEKSPGGDVREGLTAGRKHYCDSPAYNLNVAGLTLIWLGSRGCQMLLWTDEEHSRWGQIATFGGVVSFCQPGALPHPRTCVRETPLHTNWARLRAPPQCIAGWAFVQSWREESSGSLVRLKVCCFQLGSRQACWKWCLGRLWLETGLCGQPRIFPGANLGCIFPGRETGVINSLSQAAQGHVSGKQERGGTFISRD